MDLENDHADALWGQIANVLAMSGTAAFRVQVPPEQLAEVRALVTDALLRQAFPLPELELTDFDVDDGDLVFFVRYGFNPQFTTENVNALEELLQPVFQPGLPRVAIVEITVDQFIADDDTHDMGLYHNLAVTRPGMDYTLTGFGRLGATYTVTFDPPEIAFDVPGHGQWVQRYDGPDIGAEFYSGHLYNLWGELGNEDHDHWLRIENPHIQSLFLIDAFYDQNGGDTDMGESDSEDDAEGFPVLRAQAEQAAAGVRPTVTFSDLVWLPVADTSSYGHAVVPQGVTVVPSQAPITADGKRRDCDPGTDGISLEEFEPGDHIINRNGTTTCYKAENVRRAMDRAMPDPTTRQPWGAGWE